ncbi:FAD-dependent oxidoreductase [Corynebacterium poyangense]|uniref:FAD-dependent oxidoreductase n=1 Tax=Corynebacterium poyangense TaxID=2684405 RepID=UPI001CCE7768|nr:FAD-dependent oxidoreductase [Corynebacterium poyangense]
MSDVQSALGNPRLAEVGGAHLKAELRVNPRQAAPHLAQFLASRGVCFTWNTRVYDVADGVVATSRGDYCADRVIVCPGLELLQLFPDYAEKYHVRVCSLVMALLDRS